MLSMIESKEHKKSVKTLNVHIGTISLTIFALKHCRQRLSFTNPFFFAVFPSRANLGVLTVIEFRAEYS